jgi:hypothetical protein
MTVYGVLQLQAKCWQGLKSQCDPHYISAVHAVIFCASCNAATFFRNEEMNFLPLPILKGFHATILVLEN